MGRAPRNPTREQRVTPEASVVRVGTGAPRGSGNIEFSFPSRFNPGNPEMLTGFPRASFCEDAYNQRQQTAAVSRRSACSVGLGQADFWQRLHGVAVNWGPVCPELCADGNRDGVGTMPIVETEVEKPATQGA